MSDFVLNSKVCAGTTVSESTYDLMSSGDLSGFDTNSVSITQFNQEYMPVFMIVGESDFDAERRTAWEAMVGEQKGLESCAIEFDYQGYAESLGKSSYCCWYAGA